MGASLATADRVPSAGRGAAGQQYRQAQSEQRCTAQKERLFYRTLKGADIDDLFLTLIHTCQLCGANSFDYTHRSKCRGTYARVSTQNQRPLPLQTRAMREYVRVDHRHAGEKSVSGASRTRTASET